MRPVGMLLRTVVVVAALAGCASTPPPPLAVDRLPPGSTGPRGTSAADRPAPGGGLADQPAAVILARAQAALEQVRSVHLVGGAVTGDGAASAVDIRIRAGAGAVGSMTQDGHAFRFVRLGPALYVQTDAGFWRQGGLARYADQLGGRYVKLPARSPGLTGLADVTDLAALADNLLDPGADGMVTKAEPRTVRGAPTIGLVESSSEYRLVLYVALTGPPLPLEVDPDDRADVPTSFVDYNKPVTVAAPPASQVVDLAPSLGACPSGTAIPHRYRAISSSSDRLAVVPPGGPACFTSSSAKP